MGTPPLLRSFRIIRKSPPMLRFFTNRAHPAFTSIPIRARVASRPPLCHSHAPSTRSYADASTSATSTTNPKGGRPKGSRSAPSKPGAAQATRPRAKSTASKAKPKSKKKPKKKAARPKKKAAPKRKTLTPEQKRRAEIKKLKEVGFVGKEDYERRPDSLLSLVSHNLKTEKLNSGAKAISAHIKTLTPADKERLKHTLDRNHKHNAQALVHWISTKPAKDIQLANNARRLLKKRGIRRQVRELHDPRTPKRPMTAYLLFATESQASRPPDVDVTLYAKEVSAKWRGMSASEKRPYQDLQVKAHEKYLAEKRIVYGPETRSIGVQTE